MRILFTITYYAPYVSGLTIHAQRVAEALARHGYTVTVLTSQHQKELPQNEICHDVSIVRVPYVWKISKGFLMPTYIFHVLRLVKQNDIVVINLPQAEGLIPALLAKLLGKRVFCIYHCEVVLPKTPVNFIVEQLLHGANAISLFLADKIVTYTEDFAKYSRLLPFFPKKLTYIYPPIPLPKINMKVKNDLEKQLPSEAKYRIGLAARIAAEKGLEYLLESIPIMEKLLQGKFVILIAGPKNPAGEEAYWKKLAPLLKKYEDRIIFLGTLSFEEMGAFYSLLDVLVVPSINSTESFGMVQVEAMLCGTPVVASDLPGVRIPITETGMGELVKPKDTKDLAEKIVKVLQQRKNYVKSKGVIAKIFSYANSIDRYEKILTRTYLEETLK